MVGEVGAPVDPVTAAVGNPCGRRRQVERTHGGRLGRELGALSGLVLLRLETDFIYVYSAKYINDVNILCRCEYPFSQIYVYREVGSGAM